MQAIERFIISRGEGMRGEKWWSTDPSLRADCACAQDDPASENS